MMTLYLFNIPLQTDVHNRCLHNWYTCPLAKYSSSLGLWKSRFVSFLFLPDSGVDQWPDITPVESVWDSVAPTTTTAAATTSAGAVAGAAMDQQRREEVAKAAKDAEEKRKKEEAR